MILPESTRLAKTVEKLVAFYVDQHNTHLPHSAFQGQTPDEIFFGTGEQIPKQLESARLAARCSRLEANRSLCCQKCATLVTSGD
jgi:putative transposase